LSLALSNTQVLQTIRFRTDLDNLNSHTRWWLGWMAAIAVALLALYPQIDLRLRQGRDWHGAYAYIDTDEVAYSAYVNALVDGRPRRNDPYTGRDDSPGNTQPESLFSIQFIPAYLVAGAAALFRLETSSAFTLLMVVGAILSTIALFWLINLLTGDDRFAAAGALMVLCLGTLVSGQGAIQYLTQSDAAYNYLPFLRRYIPIVPFPLFFLFCGFVWGAVVSEKLRRSITLAFFAGLLFAALVYSYFFLWTSAFAWLGCVFLLVLIFRPDGWRKALLTLSGIAGISILSLIPYFWLLSHRSKGMDAAQLLLSTHKPDLTRPPELIGFLTALVLVVFCTGRRNELRRYPMLFALACAFLPAVVFNQQILTGQTLQPIHYEQFIANYVAALAVLITLFLVSRRKIDQSSPITAFYLVALAFASLSWGTIETSLAVRIYAPYNVGRDESWVVSKRLKHFYDSDFKAGTSAPVVLAVPDLLADDIPSATPDAVLWARHMHVFAGLDLEESKRRFYQLMYYTGTSVDVIRDNLTERDFYYTVALFGWDRANFNLTSEPRPVTIQEVDDEIHRFNTFTNNFDRAQAANPTLSYLVTDADDEPDLSNLDKWYVRSPAERIGRYNLYKLSLKEAGQ
jgi:hypothetical protein